MRRNKLTQTSIFILILLLMIGYVVGDQLIYTTSYAEPLHKPEESVAEESELVETEEVETHSALQNESVQSNEAKEADANKAYSASVVKEDVIDKVKSYIIDHREDDPLVEVDNDLWIKQSNVEGIVINGERYYYSLIPHMSFDPVSVGKVTPDSINIVYQSDESDDFPIVIYTVSE